MLQYMLDTNICVYVMKGYPPTLLGRFNRPEGQLAISSITLAELHYGTEKSTRRAQAIESIQQFIGQLEILPFTAAAAIHHGQIRAELQRKGSLPGTFDLLIGAHARSAGLAVVTNNLREFARMPGVRAANWV
jgi:tRNA(fMet)-specific endonuclease VapC